MLAQQLVTHSTEISAHDKTSKKMPRSTRTHKDGSPKDRSLHRNPLASLVSLYNYIP